MEYCSGSDLGKSSEKVMVAGSAARTGETEEKNDARDYKDREMSGRTVVLRRARCDLVSLVPFISLRFAPRK